MKFSSSIVHNNAPAVCMPAQVFIIVMAPAGMACKSSAGIMATIVGRFSSLSAQPPSSVPNAAAEASSTESSKAQFMEGKAVMMPTGARTEADRARFGQGNSEEKIKQFFLSAFVVNNTNPMVPFERSFVAVAHTHTPHRTARPPTAPPRWE